MINIESVVRHVTSRRPYWCSKKMERRPCSSRHLWMAAVLVTTPVDGGRVSHHNTCGSSGVALFFFSNKFA